MNSNENYNRMIQKYGADEISGGKLTGTTDTDYFYFLCPKCDGGGSQIMRILSYGQQPDKNDFEYPDLEPAAKISFNFSFELYCPKCKLRNVVKVANNGRQGGKITDFPTENFKRVLGPLEER
jgi:hypothetical protein